MHCVPISPHIQGILWLEGIFVRFCRFSTVCLSILLKVFPFSANSLLQIPFKSIHFSCDISMYSLLVFSLLPIFSIPSFYCIPMSCSEIFQWPYSFTLASFYLQIQTSSQHNKANFHPLPIYRIHCFNFFIYL